MKNAKIAITSILSLAIAGQAQAAFDYVGSDTVEPVIKELLASGSCGDITYKGEGSGAGEAAVLAGTQQTAPMSSSLDQADVCANFPNAVQAAIGVDKLIVTRNNGDESSTCDTQFVTDIAGYDPAKGPAWGEALQLVYGGKDGLGTQAACEDDLRKNLVENWGNLWADGCADGECSALRFAFRRGDSSGTTKVFKKILGITDFCNGDQFQDNDPLRTDCFDAGDVDFCDTSKGDTLGVLQAVYLEGVPLAGRKRCEFGKWDFTFASELSDELFGGNCPDDSPQVAGFLCLYPQDCDGNYGCTNWYDNASPLNSLGDGRAYNLLRSKPDAAEEPFPIKDEDTGETLAQLPAIFFNGNCSGGVDQGGTSSTRQIGCLVNQVSCSIGYGGKTQIAAEVNVGDDGQCGAVTTAQNTVTELNGVDFNQSGYPLSRKLYIATTEVPVSGNGLDCNAITNADEKALCECIFNGTAGNNALADAVINAKFEPIPGGSEIVACGQ